MTKDPAQSAPARSSKVVRSARAEALLGSAPDEQIAAALESEKWARAADLIAHFGERLLLDDGTRSLSNFLGALPEPELARHPKVLAIAAWVHVYQQRYHDARLRLSQAERALKQLELGESHTQRDEVELTPHAELKQSLAALRLHLQVVAEGKIPDDVAEIMIPASTDHPLWRAGALIILGRCRLHAGELAEARDDLQAALTLAQTSRGKRAQRTAAEASVLLGQVAQTRAALRDADQRFAEVAVRTEEILHAHVAAAEVGRASVALDRLELEHATASIARSRELAATLSEAAHGAPDPLSLSFDLGRVDAWTRALSGDPDAARATLDQVERSLTAHLIRWPMELLGIERARLALLRGDESIARRWHQHQSMQRGSKGQGADRVDRLQTMSALDAQVHLMSAQVHLALRQPEEARHLANQVLSFAEGHQHQRLAIEALVQLALAQFALAQREAARSALVAALEAAEPERMARPFVQRGLAELAAELGLAHALINRAAAVLPTAAPHRERPMTRASASGPIETAQVQAHSDSAPPANGDAELQADIGPEPTPAHPAEEHAPERAAATP